jgi:hypothetical protein
MTDPEKPGEGATVSCAVCLKEIPTDQASKVELEDYVRYFSCAVCLKEIPTDQASKVELEDYVRYFCGLDCYQKWQEEACRAAEE